jgi:hypothetical protein
MPLIRLRISSSQPKTDNHSKRQPIGFTDGIFQGMITLCPLGLLHPVKHKIPLYHRRII